MKEEPIQLELYPFDLLMMVQGLNHWGRYVRNQNPEINLSHQANQTLLRIRKQLEEKYPDLWQELTCQDSAVRWMFEDTIRPSKLPPMKPRQFPH